MMATASAIVKRVTNFRARSIRCPPMTMASNAAPKLESSMITASMEMACAADSENWGGTPAARASCRDHNEIGTRPKQEITSNTAVPVLRS